MADAFNPYAEWLGLPADLAEPNHYQLLGLPPFEADTGRIAVAADKAMSRVRGFRPGPNARAWSKLLDELLLAKGKLLDPDRKQEYDAELRESGAGSEKTETREAAAPVPFDPRFPPGMGPNSGKAAPKEPIAKAPEPAPVAPVSPAPVAVPLAAPIAAPVATFANVPPTAWPSSMLHPVAHAPAAAPAPAQAAPTQPVQPAPLAQPMAQPMYGAPVAQPAQPGYPQPMPQYPGAPQYGMPQPAYGQQPYPQYGAPAYPQSAYPQQPVAYAPQQTAPAYGQPYGLPGPTPPPAEPPVSDPFGGVAKFKGSGGTGLGGTMFGPSARSTQNLGDALGGAASAMPLDPMAPVAIPSALPGEDTKGRVVGFAAGQPAIPKGKAVSPAPSSAPVPDRMRGSALDPVNTSSAPSVPAPQMTPSLPDAAPPDTSKADKQLFYWSAGAVVLLIGAIVFAIVQGNKVNPEIAENPVTLPEPEPRVEPKPSTVPTKPIMPAVKPADPMPPTPMPQPRQPMIDPPEMTEPKPVRPALQPPEPKPPAPMPEEMKPEPKPMETVPAPKPPEPKPPEPPPLAPELKLTPAELMALSGHLKSAKEALRERNFAETETNVAAAEKLAKSADQIAKTERLKLVAGYVKQFDRSLKTLMADENFDAGAELTIGKSTRVVVVERNPSMIVLRVAGMNKTYALDALPDGLAMALIDKRLDPNDPVTKIIKASYLAAAKISTEENQEKAKALWDEAKAVDPEGVGDLPLFLTDSYDFAE